MHLVSLICINLYVSLVNNTWLMGNFLLALDDHLPSGCPNISPYWKNSLSGLLLFAQSDYKIAWSSLWPYINLWKSWQDLYGLKVNIFCTPKLMQPHQSTLQTNVSKLTFSPAPLSFNAFFGLSFAFGPRTSGHPWKANSSNSINKRCQRNKTQII